MKSKKTNPVKFFNDNKAMAKAKAGMEMKKFKKSLVKAQYGNSGPGSGMGRMYLDDLANEAVMTTSAKSPTPKTSDMGRLKSYFSNQALPPSEMKGMGNISSEPSGPYGNTTYKKLNIKPDTVIPGPYGNTTYGELNSPYIKQKKGGSIKKRKKK